MIGSRSQESEDRSQKAELGIGLNAESNSKIGKPRKAEGGSNAEAWSVGQGTRNRGVSEQLLPKMVIRCPQFIIYYLLFIIFLPSFSIALTTEGITVDLREPTLSEGVLSTDQGGVITGPDVRIQARHIVATQCGEVGETSYQICAEGDVMLEYGDYTITGSRLEYDFQTHYGYVEDGRSGLEPWYFGAKGIEILPDGGYVLHDAYVTTSPSQEPDWRIAFKRAYISPDSYLQARNIKLYLVRLPIFWLPVFKTNLAELIDSPIRYRVRWGGEQGFRFGIQYRFWESGDFRSFLRLDYRLSRGPGAAIETEYTPSERNEVFLTRSYVARDSSLEDPDLRLRYRLQGVYDRCLPDDVLWIGASYDKLSDKDLPTDYSDRDLELKTAGRTQIQMRNTNDYALTNFLTRVRINQFETLTEQLPTVSTRLHPFVLGPTGVISENYVELGYYDFKYANTLQNVNDFNSTRMEFRHNLYRPFGTPEFALTPQAGVVAIYYGNDPEHSSDWLVAGLFGGEASSHFYRIYGPCKHVLEPYAVYQYITLPNSPPPRHFIFDISDGWYRVNSLRFGTRNLFYQKGWEGLVTKRLAIDLFTYTFFDTDKVKETIPRIYSTVTWNQNLRLRHIVDTGWDFEHGLLDHLNWRTEYTVSDNLAFAAEYRNRSAFCWRRIDPDNLNLQFFRSETELRASAVSDQRDTVLLHAYWKLQHDFAMEFRFRHGWRRQNEPNYTEYQFDVLKTIRSSWNVKLSYQNTEDDHRVAFYINIGLKPPRDPCCFPWRGFSGDE